MIKYLFLGFFVVLALLSSCVSDDNSLAPLDVKAQNITINKATVKCDETPAGVFFYDVDLAKETEEFKLLKSVDTKDKLSVDISDLAVGTAYKVRVRAFNGSGKAFAQGVVSFTTVKANTDLLGTWKYTYNAYSKSYTFNKDGYGMYEDSNSGMQLIQWEAVSGRIEIRTFVDGIDGTSTVTQNTYYVGADGVGVYLKMNSTLYRFVLERN